MLTTRAILGLVFALNAMLVVSPSAVRPAVAEIAGTAADAELQTDVSRLLFSYANVLHPGCAPRVVGAEPYRDGDRSVILAGRGGEMQKLEKTLRAQGVMVVERWIVQSCDTLDRYEVLITVAASGGVDFTVRNLDPAAIARLEAPPDSVAELKQTVREAEGGDPDAQFALAVRYHFGRGVPKSEATAAEWYRKAAEQGEVTSQLNLAGMYFNGEGVAQSDSAAAFWYRKAAEQGDSEGEFNLGTLYDTGRGVAHDAAIAAQWYRKAADQGDASAAFNLGVMYDVGEGVARNDAEAVKWYELAVSRGHPKAAKRLALMREQGRAPKQ